MNVLQPQLPPQHPWPPRLDVPRTHAVLQRDVSAQPNVIEGELSRVAVAYESLKHNL